MSANLAEKTGAIQNYISLEPPGPQAPAEAVARLQQEKPQADVPQDWPGFVKNRIQEFAREDKDADWRIFSRYVVVEKFFQGEQFGRLSKLDGQWRVRPRKEGDPRYVHNLIRGHARGILSQWTQARTELIVIPLPDGDAQDDAKGAARAAEAMLDHYQRKLLTEEFKQREGMSAITTGQMFRYSYWDANAGDEVQRPQWEIQQVMGGGGYQCLDCGQSGSTEELGDELSTSGAGAGVHSGLAGASVQGGVGSGPESTVRTGAQQTSNAGSAASFGNGQPNGNGMDQGGMAGSSQSNGNGAGQGANLGRTSTVGQSDSTGDGGVCSACGSQNLTIDQPQSFDLPTISGYDHAKTGDLVCVSVPGFQLKYDRIPVRLRDSQWLRWRVYVREETVKEAIPGYKGKTGGEQDDWGYRAEQALKKSTGNVEASGARVYGQAANRTDANLTTVDRWWFRPSIYHDYKFPVPFKMADGTIVPAGEKAIDVWPDGLYILVINNEPLDFRGEDFRDHWQHTPAILLPSRIDGDGLLDDLIEPQRQMNDVEGLKLSNIKYVAGAGMIYRSEFLERQDISGKPYELSPVKPGTPLEIPLTNIIAPIPRPALGKEVYEYSGELMEKMRWMAATQEASMGEGDPNQKTASGQQMLSAAARSQRAPELALRAAGDVECGEQWLKLLQKNLTDPMFVPFQGRTGELDGMFFKAADLPKKCVVTMRPRSFIPKGENERRSDFSNFLQVLGGPQGLVMLAQAMPDLIEEASERFDVTVDVGGVNLIAQVARLRLEAMKGLIPSAQATAQQMGDPSFAVQVLTTGPETAVDQYDNHDGMIKWYVKWLAEDEGQEARKKNQLLYAAVHAQIEAHKQATVAQAQEQGQMQMAAQAPQMEQAQAMQQQQMAQQQAAQGQQADQQAQQQQAQQEAQGQAQAQQQAMQAAMEQQAADLQDQRQQQQAQMQQAAQEQQAQADHARALELEREKQKGAVQLAKLRPKAAAGK